MIKFVEVEVTFAEVPDEIALCISISNCPNNCQGCHSSYLANDIGTELTKEVISRLIKVNAGATCVCLMGGDRNPGEINQMAHYIKSNHNIKVCWYSGKDEISSDIDVHNFDYIKIGSFVQSLGGLSNKNTNQRFYQVCNGTLVDCTNKFWR